jgi:hypothetical protein
MLDLDGLVSKINESLLNSEDQHPHPGLVKTALKGPKWFRSPESGYRYLVYHIPDKHERIRRMRAIYGTTLRKISSDLWKEAKAQGIPEFKSMLNICTGLLKHWTSEYRVIAFDWCYRMKRHYRPEHYPAFESWVKTYLTTWGSVDDFCTHTMGYFLSTYPQFSSKITKWVKIGESLDPSSSCHHLHLWA